MAVTKILNLVSSIVATIWFAFQGLIEWRLGFLLSVASLTGGFIGAVAARRLNSVWLRRIFLIAVIGLAAKMLLIDLNRSSP